MKNLHLIPTDKPSRLIKNNHSQLLLTIQTLPLDRELACFPQNIYITNLEEIKEGDWLFANQGANKITDVKEGNYPYGTLNSRGDKIYHSKLWKSKIILTTDSDLIKDGVQSIDDEFLEWFVKNSSCEFIEVELNYDNGLRIVDGKNLGYYSCIIPQKEPKQETLEDAAEKYVEDFDLSFYDKIEEIPIKEFGKEDFIAGAKWQQQQDKNKYSEEDMKQFAWECVANFLSNNVNEVEMALVEVIINRNNDEFNQLKKTKNGKRNSNRMAI